MSLEKRKLLWRICSILLSLLLITVGVLLAVSCVQIYQQGDSPFTRESIGAQFSRIAVPVYICLGAVAVTAVLSLVFPVEEAKLRARVAEETLLGRLVAKEGLSPLAEKEERLRRVLRGAAVGVTVLSAALPLPVLLRKERYGGDATYNEIVLFAVLVTAAATLTAFAFWIVTSYLCHASVKRELAALRQEGAEKLKTDTACPRGLISWAKKHEKRLLLCVRCGVLALGIVLVIVGILNGGMRDVLGKAINICTECIGLG